MHQFKQVVKNCERIQSKVYGLALDVGGNNVRFGSMLQDLKRVRNMVCSATCNTTSTYAVDVVMN